MRGGGWSLDAGGVMASVEAAPGAKGARMAFRAVTNSDIGNEFKGRNAGKRKLGGREASEGWFRRESSATAEPAVGRARLLRPSVGALHEHRDSPGHVVRL